MRTKDTMPILVTSKDDLWLLLKREGILHPFRKPQPLIRIPELSKREAEAWEHRLENLRQQCGRQSGAFALAAFAILFVAYSLANDVATAGQLQLSDFARQGAILVAGLAVSALLGSLIALCFASFRFRRTCFELHQRLHTRAMIMPTSIHSCCAGSQGRP